MHVVVAVRKIDTSLHRVIQNLEVIKTVTVITRLPLKRNNFEWRRNVCETSGN